MSVLLLKEIVVEVPQTGQREILEGQAPTMEEFHDHKSILQASQWDNLGDTERGKCSLEDFYQKVALLNGS